jgi:Xaa-Pro aminopeptidase
MNPPDSRPCKILEGGPQARYGQRMTSVDDLATTKPTGIPRAELGARRERLLEHLRSQNLSGYVLFDDKYIQYFTSFGFLATERPVAFVSSASGELAVFVPEFEVDRVRAETEFERVESYPEYPGLEHPMLLLARVLRDMGIGGALATDQDGYPGILGYQGPALSEVTESSVAGIAPFVESMMVRKSDAEVALIRESARWCEHAHRLLQQYSVPGATEAEASLRASHEATLALLETLGPRFGGQQGSADGATAGYRGQIGTRSSWAHAIAHNIAFQEGDVLVTETSAPIWGYHAELERAMIIGPPTDEMRRLFDHMVAAQQTAFEALRPGVTCADVDGAVLRYFEEQDILPLWKQHTGHAIGLRNHEAPFLDIGDFTPVEPGMVFTIEPGVYAPDVGGFRHSDTVLVTEDGIDILTDYPSDIEDLTIPV